MAKEQKTKKEKYTINIAVFLALWIVTVTVNTATYGLSIFNLLSSIGTSGVFYAVYHMISGKNQPKKNPILALSIIFLGSVGIGFFAYYMVHPLLFMTSMVIGIGILFTAKVEKVIAR